MKRFFCLLICLLLCALPALAEGPQYAPANTAYCVVADDVIHLFTAEGGEAQQPLAGDLWNENAFDGEDMSDRVSLDGSCMLLAVQVEGGNRLVYFDGQELVNVAENVQDAALSTDGGRVLYMDRVGLYLYEAGQSRFITEDAMRRSCGFAADSETVYYTRLCYDAQGNRYAGVFLYDGAEEEVLRNGYLLSVSADRGVLVYLQVDENFEDELGIYVLNRATGDALAITGGELDGMYSNSAQDEFLFMPDEEETVLLYRDGEMTQIAVGNTRPVLPLGTQSREAGFYCQVLGVDTLRGTYWVNGGQENARILRLDAEGVATIAQGVSLEQTYLAQDGHTLFFLKNGSLRRLDGENPGGAPEVLADDVYGFVPVPDGSKIFYMSGADRVCCVVPGEAPVDLGLPCYSVRQEMLFHGDVLFVLNSDDRQVYRTDGGAPVLVAESAGRDIGRIVCDLHQAFLLDWSTSRGESGAGATVLRSVDGERFDIVGQWNMY